ncbi:MAG: DUF4296 domain-containing protein [Chitinophagaceae bacterium]|nr:DUF4296 domain-containing protein [Chitinophagaceae bacterium]
MMRIFIFLLCMYILPSCGNKEEIPAGILKPEIMQAVLWDVIRADAFTTDFIARDTSKNAGEENIKLQQQVFAIHKVTKGDFYKSYDYYKDNPTRFKELMDTMIKRVELADKTKPIIEN